MPKDLKKVGSAQFTGRSFHRATVMSVAMANAGIIPAPHIVVDKVCTATIRNRNDNFNQRPSIRLSL